MQSSRFRQRGKYCLNSLDQFFIFCSNFHSFCCHFSVFYHLSAFRSHSCLLSYFGLLLMSSFTFVPSAVSFFGVFLFVFCHLYVCLFLLLTFFFVCLALLVCVFLLSLYIVFTSVVCVFFYLYFSFY